MNGIKEVVDESFFEDNHSDAENAYKVFIFYQLPAARMGRLTDCFVIGDSQKRQ